MSAAILLVEDDPDVREIIAEILEDAHYQVLQASHGEDALNVLHAANELPEVIFLDMVMPVMDGRQFRAAQIADPKLADIPVVIMSALATGEREANALQPAEFLIKPLDLDRLLAVAARFCRS